jgi:hypothetical protein
LSRFRRLKVRYALSAGIHEAFLKVGSALICLNSIERLSCRVLKGDGKDSTRLKDGSSNKSRYSRKALLIAQSDGLPIAFA